jgi:hypothetical protein
MCHHSKHIGLAGILASEGKLDYEEVVEHFCKVNECNKMDFLKHREETFKVWEKRSLFEWQQDFGKYGSLLSVEDVFF